MENIKRNMANKTDPQIKIRVPEDLKNQIQTAAKICGRTQNTEILIRLRVSFEEKTRFDTLAQLRSHTP